MNKEVQVYLNDIIDSIQKIEKYTKNINKDEFLTDDELQDAIIRRLSIIGEATVKLPKEFKEKNSSIPWKKIIGMRNILIHVYSEANYESIWNTIQVDLPELKKNFLS